MWTLRKKSREKAVNAIISDRKYSFVNLKDINSVGFAYPLDADIMPNQLKNIITFFKTRVPDVHGIILETKRGRLKKLESYFAAIGEKETMESFLISKGVSILKYENISGGIPDTGSSGDFLNREYQLFVNFNHNGNFTSDYISLSANASMVAAMRHSSYVPCFFVLSNKGREELSDIDFLEQLFHYLEIIKSA
ncbi:MAG: hypothetical protein LKI53_06435 [Bacteroidales bacterium]|jgi:hypothetical protein|nr:hypothetical protein [Bacteroidales bacterium]